MQNHISIAICDDDINILDLISGAVTAAFTQKGIGTDLTSVLSIQQLRKEMETKHFDLLFLDIQMPIEDGIAYTRQLREQGNDIPVVYVSSREEKVFDALRTNPIGFVRKSGFFDDITPVVDYYIKNYMERESNEAELGFQQKNGAVRVKVGDIIYIEGNGKTQSMRLNKREQSLILHSTMETLTDQLYDYGFIRVHKGFLVNYQYIDSIRGAMVILTTGAALPLSRKNGQEVKERFLLLLKNSGGMVF